MGPHRRRARCRSERDYDLDYRAKTVFDPASGGLSLSYGYNAVSELTELKDGLQGTSLAQYDYDPLGRLKITRDGPTGTPLETYGYDATGNRTSLLRGGVTDTYSYPAASHRLSGIGATNRSYDAVGNTIAIGGTAKEYVYNANDRMRQVKQGGVVTMGYRYNAKGERVAATNGDTGPVTTYTLYDEAGHWIGDYDSAGATVQQAIWFDDAPVGLLAGAGAAQSLKYVQPDHLGTPRAVIDPARNLAIWTWDAKSEAFGNSPPNQDPDLDGVAFVFDMRFPGQRFDAYSGLDYNYFRDYDRASGRYVQSDPIGLEGGISTFAYVDSDPMMAIDELGLQTSIYDRPSRSPSFFRLTTVEALNRNRTSDQAIGDGALTRGVTLPGLTMGAGGQVIFPDAAAAYKASPVVAEGLVAGGSYVCKSPTAREMVFAACVAMGACLGKGPSMHRIRMIEQQQKVVEGLKRESRKNTVSRPGK